MRSVLKFFKPTAEAHYDFNDDDHVRKYEQKHTQTRPGLYTAYPAACRGLYAAPTKQRQAKCSDRIEQLSREQEDEDPRDPIVKYSMYPQIKGKRRSELEADSSYRYAKSDRALADEDRRDRTARYDLPVRRKHSARRVRRASRMKSDISASPKFDCVFDTDCDYSSDVGPDGRPVSVSIDPQAEYFKEPLSTAVGPDRSLAGPITVEPLPLCSSPHRYWKRDSLPYDEFQVLSRRQAMQRAREVLELHFLHFHRNAKPKPGLIGHGETQCFTEYHTARYQNSRVQYAVRKAMQVSLNQYCPEFDLAMTRRARNERFCEMSDVEGVPVDERLMMEFLKAYLKFQNEAYVIKPPELAMVRPGELAKRASVDERNDQMRQSSLRRVDSGAAICVPAQLPVPVSCFDWDDSDDEVEKPKRLVKLKRDESDINRSDGVDKIGFANANYPLSPDYR